MRTALEPALLQCVPGQLLVREALVVDVARHPHRRQLAEQALRVGVVADVLGQQQQDRHGFELEHREAVFRRQQACGLRQFARGAEIAGLPMQVRRDLLAHQDRQARANSRRCQQREHPVGQPLRGVPALVALHAAEQGDGGGELLVLGAAGHEHGQHALGQGGRVATEVATEEARQQLTVEQAQRMHVVARRNHRGQRRRDQRTPALVAGEAVAVVAPLQHAGRAQLLAMPVVQRFERGAGPLVMRGGRSFFAQETQPRPAIHHQRMLLPDSGRHPLVPSAELIELAARELVFQHRQPQRGGARMVAGIERHIERDIEVPEREKCARCAAPQCGALGRQECLAAAVEQEVAQQGVQPVNARVDPLGEEVAPTQPLQVFGRIGHPGQFGEQAGGDPGQQGAHQQQMPDRRGEPVVQHAGEIVEQQRRGPIRFGGRRRLAEQAQTGGPATDPQRGGADRDRVEVEGARIGLRFQQREVELRRRQHTQ